MLENKFNLSIPERDALHRTLIWTEGYFQNVPEGAHIGGHGFDKTMRQAGMAAVIAKGEGQPVFLPVLTAMIMDAGRASQDPRSRNFQHAALSREMIEADLFPSLDTLTPEDMRLVADAVEDHSRLNKDVRRSYVVEIAMDADRLDCLGALGPLRSASWNHNLPLILLEEVDNTGIDGELKSMYQDMAHRQLGWVDMLWTCQSKIEMSPP